MRINGPDVADLRTVSRSVTKGRSGRQGGRVKRTERVDRVVVVVDIAYIDPMIIAGPPVDARNILPEVERIQNLEGRIVVCGCIGVRGGVLDHRAVNVHDGAAVGRHQTGYVFIGNGVLCAWIIDGVSSIGKIPIELGERWQGLPGGISGAPDFLPFLPREEEQL